MLRLRRPIDRGLLLASMGLALGIGAIGFAFSSAVTGKASTGLPEAIENIAPQRDDDVLRQAQIMVDLAAGYAGRLVIDNREIDVVEVAAVEVAGQSDEVNQDVLVTRFDPGSRILTYQPQEGAPITSFAAGIHQVVAIYWPVASPEEARSFTWQFRVTA